MCDIFLWGDSCGYIAVYGLMLTDPFVLLSYIKTLFRHSSWDMRKSVRNWQYSQSAGIMNFHRRNTIKTTTFLVILWLNVLLISLLFIAPFRIHILVSCISCYYSINPSYRSFSRIAPHPPLYLVFTFRSTLSPASYLLYLLRTCPQFSPDILPLFLINYSYSDWLRAGRLRSRSSSPGRVKNFLFSTSSRPALESTQPPI
jgi:hypothetical protein